MLEREPNRTAEKNGVMGEHITSEGNSREFVKRNLLQNTRVVASVKAVAAMVIIISSSSLCKDESQPGGNLHLAVLSSKEIQESGLSDVVIVEVQNLAGVELVERDLLQKVLDEVALTMMLGADQPENRRKAGALLKADMLVLLSLQKGEDSENVKVVISDCSSGARLHIGWVPFEKDRLEDTSRELTKAVQDTLERFKEGVRQIIGVSYFISRNLVHDYDHLQAGYTNLLGNALSSLPGIAVIEIEEARSIRLEEQLAGDMQTDRVIPLFVEGEFRVDKGRAKKPAEVHMTVRISDNAGTVRQIERTDLSMDKVAQFITNDVATELLRMSKAPSLKVLDKQQQLEKLAARASEFARVGAWKHSVGLREAAVLLRPDSAEQRVQLVHEYCLMGQRRRGIEHLEFMIFNQMIDIGKASALSKKLFSEKSYRRHFLRGAFLEILNLEPSKQSRARAEYQAWYKLLVTQLLSARYGPGCGSKDDLEFYLHIQESVLPEKLGPSRRFILFLQDHIVPGWSKRRAGVHSEPFYFAKHPEHFSEQDFLDFITALSLSKKPLASFYGQYALLYHEYHKRRRQGEAMNDLRDEAALLVNEMNEHRFRGKLAGEVLKKIEQYIQQHNAEAKEPSDEERTRE
jgi:hypothetical protein